ncbi:MAG: M4 family metallopeptidase [Bacteroidota bacterium]
MIRLALGMVALLAYSAALSQQVTEMQQWLEVAAPIIQEQHASKDGKTHVRLPLASDMPGFTLQRKAQNLLSQLLPVLELPGEDAEFRLLKEDHDVAGNYHLKFQHYYANIPVFDGYFQVHFNAQTQLQGFDGLLLKDMGSAETNLGPEEAFQRAVAWVSKHYPDTDLQQLETEEELLTWYPEGLVQGKMKQVRLAYEISLTNREDIREHLIIDAQNGQVITHFSGICQLAHRQLFSGNTNSNPIWQDGDVFPGELSDWQQTQIHTSEEVYNFFLNSFGIHSFDALGSDMLMVDQASFLNCPNANWNGYSTNYCNAISSDDVVGHEWGHAYTEFAGHQLFAWQAGAINEAYSDIWGETIDLLNSEENANPLRTDCGDSDRWLIAEEAAALDGAIRDMWNPNCTEGPGKVSDPFYQCSDEDFGGVHINSGVVTHAYALLTDGGSYNGYDIAGIGLTKAAHLFWHAQAHYLRRTSDFPQLADALSAAYLDLRGTPLPELSLATDFVPTFQELTAADSLSLQQTIAAVELRMAPLCEDFASALQPGAPEICLANGYTLTPFFSEEFETGTSGWTLSAHPDNPESWVPRHWMITDELPNERTGKAAFAVSPAVGHCDTFPNNGGLRLKTPLIPIPADVEGNVYLVFDHYFSLEDGMDGANVKVQQNGGSWLRIPPIAFLHNGYNDLLPNASETDNPLAGDRVWTGADIGSTTGTWGTTQINLSVLGVEAGESIRLRWELGTDGCDGWDGWYVDDIHVGSCALAIVPVEWLGFTATMSKERPEVQLEWQTTQEENNAGFYVERSTDGRQFTDIGYVAAANSPQSDINTYTFWDKDLPLNMTTGYYRLRQVDLDGTVSYSPIRVVDASHLEDWQVLPNPATNYCEVVWRSAPFQSATISLRQAQGRLVTQINNWEPNAPAQLNLTAYPPGVYLLQIQAGDQLVSRRLVIQ